ncbi:MFS transporter [Salmonella enterica subsp. enterica serovar Choleraesuis]|nr:MFS transporter [Salmonella enterica subsp. enterica serovar Choleraesuis]
MADIRGIYGISRDGASWLSSVYAAGEVSAMLLAPWLAVTFSLRRFALVATLAFTFLALIFPLITSLNGLVVMRTLQGLAGGFLPPLLMTAALRFLPWHAKLYGLSAYALTATFGPNVAMSLAALWTEIGDWHLVFWVIIPIGFVGASLIAYGLPQDPLKLERFKQFDWRGVLLGCGSITMLTLALTQGERLDWLNSPLICWLLLGSALGFPLFLINEWFHPLPLLKLQLLARHNFAFGNITLALFLFVAMAGGAIPAAYLTEIQGYRPLEIAPTALCIALPQLVVAPLVAFVINRNWVDSRYVMGLGLLLLTIACIGGSLLTSEWNRDNFYALQVLHTFGQPMIVVPLLMNATGVVHPMEGPFASAMVNSIRGFSAVAASSFLENLITQRERFHSHILLDNIGNKVTLSGAEAMAELSEAVRAQAFVLSYSDAFLALLGVIAVMYVVLLTLPKRAYPPQPH